MYLILSLEFCFSISMLLLLFFLVFILNVKAASGVFVQHLAFGFCYYCSRKKRKKKCVGCLVLRINRNDIQYLNVLYCNIYHIQNSKASSSFVRKSVAFIIIHIKHILYVNIFFIFPLFLRVLSCAVHSLYVHSGLLFIFFFIKLNGCIQVFAEHCLHTNNTVRSILPNDRRRIGSLCCVRTANYIEFDVWLSCIFLWCGSYSFLLHHHYFICFFLFLCQFWFQLYWWLLFSLTWCALLFFIFLKNKRWKQTLKASKKKENCRTTKDGNKNEKKRKRLVIFICFVADNIFAFYCDRWFSQSPVFPYTNKIFFK